MGGNISSFDNNQSLIESLKETYRFSKDIERILRLVDRKFYSTDPNHLIYSDTAWRCGDLHLSAPGIYCVVIREMELHPGLSVLNIGSGTGYLSTIFGLMLGSNSVNHGIEVSTKNITFAKQRLIDFMRTSDAVYEYDFCPPHFILGNIFSLVPPLNSIQPPPSMPVDTEPTHDSNTHVTEITVSLDVVSHSYDQPFHNLTSIIDDIAQESIDLSDDYTNMEVVENIICSGNFEITSPPSLQTSAYTCKSNGKMSHFFSRESPIIMPWPMYDRIYVGSEVTTQGQLEAILRLLKIGGFLVAPVNERLMKITRTGENTTSALNLINVSFVSLTPPPTEDSSTFELPPPRTVERLERLTCRAIRRQLRTVIHVRHNGPPVLGHYEDKQKAKESDLETGECQTFSRVVRKDKNEVSSESFCQPSHDPSIENCEVDSGISLSNNELVPSKYSISTETPSSSFQTNKREASPGKMNIEASPPKKRCELEDESSIPSHLDSNSSNTNPSSDEDSVQRRNQNVRIVSPYVAILASILNPRSRVTRLQNDDVNASSNTTSHDMELTNGEVSRDTPAYHQNSTADNETTSTSQHEKDKQEERLWIPQSYTYREEMLHLLSEEMDASDFLIQRVLSII